MKIVIQIKLVSQSIQEREFSGDKFVVGRSSDCELTIDESADSVVSWKQFVIEENGAGEVIVVDLASTNGTYLNGIRLVKQQILKPGDRINIGKSGPQIKVLSLLSSDPKASAVGHVIPVKTEQRSNTTVPRVGVSNRFEEYIAVVRAWGQTGLAVTVATALIVVLGLAVSHKIEGELEKAPRSVALKAKEVLERNCYECHGKGGSDEGGFNFVLDRDGLVDSGYFVPGDTEDSYALTRMIDKEMPPAAKSQPLSELDIDIVTDWVRQGMPPFREPTTQGFVSNSQMFDAIENDLLQANERSRKFLRYFTLVHLVNAGRPEQELEQNKKAISKLINSLSHKRQISIPQDIGEHGAIMRIDLRDYTWDADTWDLIVRANPYAITYSLENAKSCTQLAETSIPFVRGDWFIFAASRPPLYHDVLKLPTSDVALETVLNINAAQNIREETVMRAGFVKSGVSQNNRLIERHDFAFGAYWKSYDFESTTGRQNLFEFPLGPASAVDSKWSSKSFIHAGGEIIFNLPNGLQAYFLTDSRGNRINKGPTSIVSDPLQPDKSVINGISCMSCHYDGIKTKRDEVRKVVVASPASFPEYDVVLAIYPDNETMTLKMEQDAALFQDAVKTTGVSISDDGEPITIAARRFEEELSIEDAAGELGVQADDLRDAIRDSRLARQIGPLLLPGGTVKRQVFSDVFGEIVTELAIGTRLR
jgi:mono/diheme cytochrome c family protein